MGIATPQMNKQGFNRTIMLRSLGQYHGVADNTSMRIGNSRGVRLSKPLLEQAGLEDEVELRVEAGAIMITGRASRAVSQGRTATSCWTRYARSIARTS